MSETPPVVYDAHLGCLLSIPVLQLTWPQPARTPVAHDHAAHSTQNVYVYGVHWPDVDHHAGDNMITLTYLHLHYMTRQGDQAEPLLLWSS